MTYSGRGCGHGSRSERAAAIAASQDETKDGRGDLAFAANVLARLTADAGAGWRPRLPAQRQFQHCRVRCGIRSRGWAGASAGALVRRLGPRRLLLDRRRCARQHTR